MGSLQGHMGLLLAGGAGGQPSLANSDDFSTNTIASYTVTGDGGTPAFSVSGGFLIGDVANNAKQAICRRNSFSQADVSVETTTSAASDSGLVLRFQDQSNFYLMTLSDASGVTPSTKVRVFKRVGGSFSQIGSSYNFTWARGTPHTFRFSMVGSDVTAYVDGVAVITGTDSSISAAGAIGVRSNFDSNDKFDSLAWG